MTTTTQVTRPFPHPPALLVGVALISPPALPGDIISRLSADTTQVSDLVSQNVNVFLRNCIKALGHFAFMWGISWKLTLVAVMGFPFIGLVSQLYGDYYKVGAVGWGGVLPKQPKNRGKKLQIISKHTMIFCFFSPFLFTMNDKKQKQIFFTKYTILFVVFFSFLGHDE